jgi:hypothetical protein
LQRAVSLRQNPAGQMLAGFFKQYKQNGGLYVAEIGW